MFVFIFLSSISIVESESRNTETDKTNGFIVKKDTINSQIVKEETSDSIYWEEAKASFYDSKDPSQTKSNCDGRGASGRMIRSGSIALGSTFTKSLLRKKEILFIQVKGCEIITPYGKGIFRVDDMMNDRYNNKKDKYFIDFYHGDVSSKQRRLGRFKIRFRLIKKITPDNDTLLLSGFLYVDSKVGGGNK